MMQIEEILEEIRDSLHNIERYITERDLSTMDEIAEEDPSIAHAWWAGKEREAAAKHKIELEKARANAVSRSKMARKTLGVGS